MFDLFWELYPRKEDKNLAKIRWNKICNKADKPAWSTIKKAIEVQSKTERWKTQPKFIPYPTTWLNQARWNDDPKEILPYVEHLDQSKAPKEKYWDGMRYKLAQDGYYYNAGGERWID